MTKTQKMVDGRYVVIIYMIMQLLCAWAYGRVREMKELGTRTICVKKADMKEEM